MNDIKNVFTNITKNIAKASGGIVKTTKLSMELSNEEMNLKSIYMEIGKKVHEIYAYGGSLGEFFDGKYNEILETEQKIKNLQKELDIAKGTKTCGKCGASSPRNSEFCSKCGVVMEKDEKISEHSSGYENKSSHETYAEDRDKGYIDTRKTDSPPLANKTASDTHEKTSASEEKICGSCGKENQPTDKFCLYCGRKL